MLVDFVRWLSLKRIAAERKADALAADALHFSSDIVGPPWRSAASPLHFTAIRKAMRWRRWACWFHRRSGLQYWPRTVNTLIDAAPKGLTEQIRSIVQAFPA